MKTLKKLFSVSAIVALLGTLAPMYAFGASSLDLDKEFPAAYAYAYTNGITTQSEANVDMGGKLTRIAMAKMIAKYAINVLGLEPDTSLPCTFADVPAALDAQYDNGVKLACQLGLMGQNMPENKFRPDDLVTRAQFGTTLSRALNYNSDNLAAMNAANPYYKEHLKYLNETKGANGKAIMGYITDPDMLEVRGYVMLMMMRADESYSPSSIEGCTAEQVLSCLTADDFDACVAECSEPENPEEPTNPGYATVSTKAASDQTVALNAVDKKIGTVTLKAGENDTTVTALEITKSGLGAAADVATISLMKNGEYVTNAASLNSNKVAKLRFRPNLTLKAKSSETFDVVVSMAGSDEEGNAIATAGGIHEFSVTSVTVSNGTFGGTPARLGSLTTSNYTVGELEATMENQEADAGDENKEIAVINLKPETNVTVDSIILTSENNNDSLLDVIKNAKAYIDDEVVGRVTVNEETITIAGLNKSIAKNKSIDVIVKADVIFAGDPNTSFTFTIEENRVIATEDSTNERVHVAEEEGKFTITNGIGLTLTNNVKKDQKVVVDTEDVVLMDIDVESAANIDVLDYTLVFEGYDFTGYLEDIRVSVDGDEFDLPLRLFVPGEEDAITNSEINLKDKQLNAFSIDAGKKANVKVLATVKDGESYNVTLSINKVKNTDTNKIIYKLSDDEEPVLEPLVDPLQGHTTSVTDGSLNVTKKSTTGNTIRVGEQAEVLAFTVKAKAEDATLKTLYVEIPGTDALEDVIDSVVLKQGSTTKSVKFDTTKDEVVCAEGDAPTCTVEFKSLSISLKEDTPVDFSIELKVNGDIAVSDLGTELLVNIPANGLVAKGKTSENNEITNKSAVPGKTYQVVTTKPTVEVSQDGKYITVTVNNESDYDVLPTALTLNVLSERNANGNALLSIEDIAGRKIHEASKDGTVLSASTDGEYSNSITLDGNLPGEITITFDDEEVAGNRITEDGSLVFVIEMVSTVSIKTTDYTAEKTSLSFTYWDEDVEPDGAWLDTAITETY